MAGEPGRTVDEPNPTHAVGTFDQTLLEDVLMILSAQCSACEIARCLRAAADPPRGSQPVERYEAAAAVMRAASGGKLA